MIVHAAGIFGCRAIVGILLKKGADVHARNDSGRTPLHSHCSAFGNILHTLTRELTEQILHLDFQQHGNSILALIEAGADVNARDARQNTPLLLLADHIHPLRKRFMAATYILINKGADYSQRTADGKSLADLVRERDPVLAQQLEDEGAGSGTTTVVNALGGYFPFVTGRPVMESLVTGVPIAKRWEIWRLETRAGSSAGALTKS